MSENQKVLFTLGGYDVLERIGAGGMGEVFKAYDPICGRTIALKKIRGDLAEKEALHRRFLHEARITSQLNHPAIVPVYTIHCEENLLYYTMPYIAGETLSQIFRRAVTQEKSGLAAVANIPYLTGIFLKVCQAVAYAHARGVLHRDLKPENIMIGKYGEVMILDWGLAKTLDEKEEGEQTSNIGPGTRLGKTLGTVAYMSPERILGEPATPQSDVYALGVMLYEILTLHLPFARRTIKEAREELGKEVLVDPDEVAPYRHVPNILSNVVKRSLAAKSRDRYESVDALIHDLESYVEGRAEWLPAAKLHVDNKEDWEFQANVLLAEQVAVTRGTDVTDWVVLMISRNSFSQDVKLSARVRIGPKGQGLGLLLSVPEATERVVVNEGLCLWLSSPAGRGSKLTRSAVEVMNLPGIVLGQNSWHDIVIEKIDNTISVTLDGIHQFSHVNLLPLVGTHVGLLARDGDFEVADFSISIGSGSLTVSCLAVPDAFLAHKSYEAALSEYRRIANAFRGHAEGREALFRAGVTLMVWGKDTRKKKDAARLWDLALEEFEKLHATPGAPLEYLGKALVYQTLGDYDDELKCYELAVRRYPRHPLLTVLEEHIVSRMHDASRQSRLMAYGLISLVVRHFRRATQNPTVQHLFQNVQRHWEPLPFVEEEPQNASSTFVANMGFATVLAFWQGQPLIIEEIVDELLLLDKPPLVLIGNALFCLVVLGSTELVRNLIKRCRNHVALHHDGHQTFDLIALAATTTPRTLKRSVETFFQGGYALKTVRETATLLFLLEKALDADATDLVVTTMQRLPWDTFTAATRLQFDTLWIWALLQQGNMPEAGDRLHRYPLEVLNKETSLLHFLYGCWLLAVEGKTISDVHFAGAIEVTYPRSFALTHHYLLGKIGPHTPWFTESSNVERRQLYRQLALYHRCAGERMEARRFSAKAKRTTTTA